MGGGGGGGVAEGCTGDAENQGGGVGTRVQNSHYHCSKRRMCQILFTDKVLQTIRCRGQMEVRVGVLPICPKITLTGPLTNEPHSLLRKSLVKIETVGVCVQVAFHKSFTLFFCYFRALHRPSGRIMAVKVSGLFHCGMMKT